MSCLFLGEALTPHSVFWHLGHSEVLVTLSPYFISTSVLQQGQMGGVQDGPMGLDREGGRDSLPPSSSSVPSLVLLWNLVQAAPCTSLHVVTVWEAHDFQL